MKNLVYLAALAAAFVGGRAYAEGGYIGASYSNMDRTLCGGTARDIESAAASGAATLGQHVQLDGQYANIDTGECDHLSLAAHLFSRNERFLWGGYVGRTSLTAVAGSVDEWHAGLEGQLYLARTTLTGAAGYTSFDVGGASREVWSFDAEARHFFGDNFSVQANAGYADADASLIGDGWSIGLGAEYQLANAPISIYGGWQRADFAEEIESVGLGVRYSWNATLFERNRSGPSLNRPQGVIERVSGGYSPR